MASQSIYQFYAELSDYKPKIWRRFQVAKNITVARLGYIIMTMFEMQAGHLFCVEVDTGGNMYRAMKDRFPDKTDQELIDFVDVDESRRFEVHNASVGESEDENVLNAAAEKIYNTIYRPGDELSLCYDYGDGWEIRLVLEKIIEDRELPGKELPRVLEGEGYGIIEDCGGTCGLEDITKAYKKKKGAAYKEYCEWLGLTELDLSAFDVADMNFRLKKVPRIYTNIYEYGLEPTKQSINLLSRKYKK